jgi:hypothetical protein
LIAAVLIVIITITIVAARIPAGGLDDDVREERYEEQQERREDRLEERQESLEVEHRAGLPTLLTSLPP